MDSKSNLIVEGFIFNSEADAQLARQEVEKIEYLEKRMNYMLPENMLEVYEKTLENKLVQTPVGWNYLYNMRLKMEVAGIDEAKIPPIPLYGTFAYRRSDELSANIAKQRIKSSAKKEKPVDKRYRVRFFVAVGVCLALLVVVVGMFRIALQSRNPNILNYKEAILNQYAAWEQELTEREKAVREKELELKLAE